MAGIVENLMKRMGFVRQPTMRRIAARTFAAAQSSPLVSSWTTTNYSADQELLRTLDVMRARSRELAQNNDYAKKFLQMVENNVVGPDGFTLQSKAPKNDGTVDATDSASIERAFGRWAKIGVCEVSGQLAFPALCRLILRTVARDGECLIRRVRGKGVNDFGYAHQVIDVDRLWTQQNGRLSNGNYLALGIEINSFGAPVFYHIRTSHPAEYGVNAGDVKVERVPASDVFHLFRAERAEQHRGVPWMHTAMLRLQMLGGFEEAAVVAARAGAAKMGFYVSPDGELPPSVQPETAGETADNARSFVQDAQAGTFEVVPEGYDFRTFDPAYPHAHYDAFIKACLRGIASGLGVAYNSLANDLEGVNYSSIRAGLLDERDHWMALQAWFVEAYLTPTFEEWLDMALLNEQVIGPAGQKLPVSRYDKFAVHRWQPRRWPWVDPMKDIEAELAAIDGGLKSRTQSIAEKGGDIADTWAELAAEKTEAERLKLDFKTDKTPAQKPQQGAANAGNSNTQG